LEGCWDYELGLLRWVARELWEDVAKLFLISFRDRHLPETVLDIKLAEKEGPLFRRAGAYRVDDASKSVA
jgi:hypothetical protein